MKPVDFRVYDVEELLRSIHPQGWVRGGRMVVAMHSASTVRVKPIVAIV